MLETGRYRAALMARLEELDTRLHMIESELDCPKTRDFSDMAIEREGDEVLEHLGQSGQEEIARIRAALARIRDGSYGVCVQCDERISTARLEILPETPLCRQCAAQIS
ncbi:transcriptional regulator, TraR/DksA family [Roseovarius azorensis]|uniref:Transcriptional regulator, TraR/DksA family n=1 Tax=Roseovarius azorensis TaxID=1287727 RepID=A0A1H7U1X6_9RHOB|nr:TraR/DksA C4-type zinc finger protein [Roseovarius azorensis]SEL90688.1 transcriptional regulator, TraR/DksA family [Roseovarius azorensis]